jgi:hypothetical protein
MRLRQHSCRKGRYVLGPPSSSTLCLSVEPRVSTERFWSTIASASEHRISSAGMPLFTRLTMSVSAKTPHLAATWWSFEGRSESRTSSGGRPTLIMHLSMVAPVPDAHLSFIDGDWRLLAGLLVGVLEDDDLRVLTAELDHRADVGVQRLHRERDGVDLLHKLRRRARGTRASPPSPS